MACSEDTDCPSSHMCNVDGMCSEKVAHPCVHGTGADIDHYCGCGSHCEDTDLCGLTETIGRSCNGTVSCGESSLMKLNRLDEIVVSPISAFHKKNLSKLLTVFYHLSTMVINSIRL